MKPDTHRRTGRTTAMVQGVVTSAVQHSSSGGNVFVVGASDKEAMRIKNEFLRMCADEGVETRVSARDTVYCGKACLRFLTPAHNLRGLQPVGVHTDHHVWDLDVPDTREYLRFLQYLEQVPKK